MKLGLRLAAIAAMVPPGSCIADIGTDHGYLPIYLVQQGIVPQAIASDVNTGPYRAAMDSVGRSELAGKIAVRQGDGLAVLSPGEATAAIIAGMGGVSIINILTENLIITSSLSRLIIQPMLGAGLVRRWLVANKWSLVAETLVAEEERLYEIIVAEPGQAPGWEDILLEIGPLLWQERHPLLKTHLGNLISQGRRVLAEMAFSSEAVQSAKYLEYSRKVAQLEEKWACL